MRTGSASINLVKVQINLLDEFVKWALNIGRLLVIVTELIAFSTFIYRFTLDRRLVDLNTKILQEQAVVSSLKTQEEIYRNLQERILIAENISTQGTQSVKILNDIISFSPADLNFNSLILQENNVKINANAFSVSSLTSFINSLKNYPQVSNVSIDKIGNKTSSSTINVAITAHLKENTK